MSRSSLLASFLSLPLLATACTDPSVEAPPTDLQFAGAGVDADGVWYLPGHADTLIAWSTDERRPDWRFVVTGDAATGGDTMHGASGSSVALTAQAAPGAGIVSLLDPDDLLMGQLPLHVTYPDRVLLVGELGGSVYLVGDEAHILAGGGATFGVSYAYGQHLLAGKGLIAGDEHVELRPSDRDDQIVLWADAGPYRAWMTAGPDASRFVDVIPTAAGEVIFELGTTESGAAPGDIIYFTRRVRTVDGDPVFGAGGTWFRDGQPIEPIQSYELDPTAPGELIEVRIGPPGNQAIATTTIHRAS